MQDLKKQFESIVDQYITIFCEKQEIDKKGLYWINGDIGGVFEVCDCFFDFLDIKRDIDTDQPKDKIFNWYWDNDYINNKIINYHSYIKGLRIKDLK
jgi:hypothetical protein